MGKELYDLSTYVEMNYDTVLPVSAASVVSFEKGVPAKG